MIILILTYNSDFFKLTNQFILKSTRRLSYVKKNNQISCLVENNYDNLMMQNSPEC